jgi:hypothetical protein
LKRLDLKPRSPSCKRKRFDDSPSTMQHDNSLPREQFHINILRKQLNSSSRKLSYKSHSTKLYEDIPSRKRNISPSKKLKDYISSEKRYYDSISRKLSFSKSPSKTQYDNSPPKNTIIQSQRRSYRELEKRSLNESARK